MNVSTAVLAQVRSTAVAKGSDTNDAKVRSAISLRNHNVKRAIRFGVMPAEVAEAAGISRRQLGRILS